MAKLAVEALAVAPRAKASNYPEPFASRMQKRVKRQLGDRFGLKAFGVNLTELLPGGELALLHRHTTQDEFVYILDGRPTLVTDQGEEELERSSARSETGLCSTKVIDPACWRAERGRGCPIWRAS